MMLGARVERAVVLGASDPEMDLIERILEERLPYCRIHYASYRGKRVTPTDAYRADSPAPRTGQMWIECAPSGGFGDARVHLVDHHHPGDPGYDCSAREYWRGSSVGQVFEHFGFAPTKKAQIAAAADHCLFEAYRGECPGVDAEDVWKWQSSQTIVRHQLTPEVFERSCVF